ncbi:MAG: hypothetical protein DRQ62_05590 [Gammaproteobacteria bacterium]|nr:MAG: hypothetical protein DRQ62_05590 [Gammaproteobacteria bacterium]
MRAYDPDNCTFCRLMRSLAFTGVGMGIGCGTAYLLGATQENIIMSGIVVSTIIVFGLLDKNKKKK